LLKQSLLLPRFGITAQMKQVMADEHVCRPGHAARVARRMVEMLLS
jgi:hypothetical protein